jgi:hypothetical protein
MGWANKLLGWTTNNGVEVDANHRMLVNTPMVEADAGYSTLQCEVDSGAFTGSRTLRQPQASVLNRMFVGLDTVIFADNFNLTAQNSTLWKTATTTFTSAFAGGYLVFNSGNVNTANAATLFSTWRTFPMTEQQPMLLEFRAFFVQAMPTWSVFEIGFFAAPIGSTPFAPTDGVFFRFNPNGVVGVLNYNGTETAVTLVQAANMHLNDNTTYRIVINTYRVEFWGETDTSGPRVLLGIIPTPSANGPPFATYALPVSMRHAIVGGTAGALVQPKISGMVVIQQDINQGRDYATVQAGQGLIASQGQNGGTLGTTALYTNSLAAGAGAAMTNTTAALGTGLGGQFSALPTLAAGTDGIVCSYQNPAGSVTQTPRVLYITGIKIMGIVTTILAGGPVLYAYSLAYGHNLVTLANAEGIAAKAPRRVALGFDTYATNAAVGVVGSAQGLTMQFLAPIVVNPGEFVAVVAKNLGVVTTTGVITFHITIDGFWE